LKIFNPTVSFPLHKRKRCQTAEGPGIKRTGRNRDAEDPVLPVQLIFPAIVFLNTRDNGRGKPGSPNRRTNSR
jgi:hypothetical protein